MHALLSVKASPVRTSPKSMPIQRAMPQGTSERAELAPRLHKPVQI
jgi:hypothetical protein